MKSGNFGSMDAPFGLVRHVVELTRKGKKMIDEKDIRIFSDMIKALEDTSSTKAKQKILETYIDSGNTALLLEYVYNPYYQYYLTSDNVGKVSKRGGFNTQKEDLIHVLWDLKNRHVTGNQAKERWAALLSNFPSSLHDTLNRILDKDLKCRTGAKIVNKALEATGHALLPVFNVALGKPWKHEDVWDTDPQWYASRKIDGVRCLAFITRNSVTLMSRAGKPFDTLSQLANELGELRKKVCKVVGISDISFVLDGELALHNPDGPDDFQGLMKRIRRKNYQITNAVFHVFDYIDSDEFDVGQGVVTFYERQKTLKELLGHYDGTMIHQVNQYVVSSERRFNKLWECAQERGWEGLILRRDVPYEGKRSANLLKVKHMPDMEARVEDVETGTMNVVVEGKEKTINVMSAAIIEYKGNKVKVGSGWTVEERLKFCKEPDKIVGKIITVQYFEETKNQDGGISLRFPVKKAIHGDERIY